jgi:hypothetical protein
VIGRLKGVAGTRFPRRTRRTIMAFVIAPVVPTIAIAALFDLRDAAYYLAVFGYPVAFGVGVPIHLLLRRLGWSGGFIYLGAGAVAAIIGEWLYGIGLTLADPTPAGQSVLLRLGDTIALLVRAPELAVVIGACGAVAALAFWLIVAPLEPLPERATS